MDWSGLYSGCVRVFDMHDLLLEQFALRPLYYRMRFHEFRKNLR